MRCFLALLFGAFVFSCGRPDDGGVVVYDINPRKTRELVNDLEYSHYVVLRTPDHLPLGKLKKLQIIGDRIFYLDLDNMAVFVFTMQGDYVNHIGKVGRAENEYQHATDFEVDKNGVLYIYAHLDQKILKYDLDGRYLGSSEAVNGNSFKLLDNGVVAYNLGNGSNPEEGSNLYYNYVCDTDVEKIREIPFNRELLGNRFSPAPGESGFYVFGDKIFASFPLNDTIYSVNAANGHLSPLMAFRFSGTERRPEPFDSGGMDYFLKMLAGDIPTSPFGFAKREGEFMVRFWYNGTPCVVRGKMGRETVKIGIMGTDKYGIPFLPIVYHDGDDTGYTITMLESVNIEKYSKLCVRENKDTRVFDSIKTEPDVNDNPILVFYR